MNNVAAQMLSILWMIAATTDAHIPNGLNSHFQLRTRNRDPHRYSWRNPYGRLIETTAKRAKRITEECKEYCAPNHDSCIYDTICGSDGIIYTSSCQFACAKCKDENLITMVDNYCEEPQENLQRGKKKKKCKDECLQEDRECKEMIMCASNGRFYYDRCHFICANCLSGGSLTEAKYRQCAKETALCTKWREDQQKEILDSDKKGIVIDPLVIWNCNEDGSFKPFSCGVHGCHCVHPHTGAIDPLVSPLTKEACQTHGIKKECKEFCAPTHDSCTVDMICGSNGIIYTSSCQFACAKCKDENLITMIENYCEESQGNLQSGKKKNKCKDECLQEDRECKELTICASNGRFYYDSCHFTCAKCLSGDSLTEAKHEQCDTETDLCVTRREQQQKEILDNDMKGTVVEPVVIWNCNEDGSFKPFSCGSRGCHCIHPQTGEIDKQITPFIAEDCQTHGCANNDDCMLGALCDKSTNSCKCAFSCPSADGIERQEVCGSDGKVYHSVCALQHEACKHQINITVQHAGNCFVQDSRHAGLCMTPPKARKLLIIKPDAGCTNMCINDAECAEHQKCCDSGCGLQCTESIHAVRPGRCPVHLLTRRNSCEAGVRRSCQYDADCTVQTEKCCLTPCGQTCLPPTSDD